MPFREALFAIGRVVLDLDNEVGSICPKLQKFPPT
jgi:hypothetical protein